MNSVLIGLLILAAMVAVNFLCADILRRFARPLSRVDHLVSFPWSVTLSISRDEVPLLRHSGVYDAVAIQRNPYAFELRLVNTTDPKSVDPFSFYVPLDQTALRALADIFTAEAKRLDVEGSPHWKD